jgi:hypothetical protein
MVPVRERASRTGSSIIEKRQSCIRFQWRGSFFTMVFSVFARRCAVLGFDG